MLPVSFEDVLAASKRLDGIANKTPVMTSRTLDEKLGAKIYLKCENYQRMGAFKFRGAYNALSQLSDSQASAGVLTYSSGNHAQAIALSGKLLGISATIIMPEDAPFLKIQATKEYGGNVVMYDRYKEDRELLAQKLQEEQGSTIIPPYNHRDVIAGQGTAGLELFQEVGELDYLFVCVGGGGLISGCSIAAKEMSPNCKVYGVEPEAGNDAQQSLEKGEIVHIQPPKTIADGAATPHLGELTFEIMKKNVEGILTVTDQELIEEMKFCAERMKMVIEPTGCLGLAGVKHCLPQIQGKKVGIIISGGNVDLKRFSDLITQ